MHLTGAKSIICSLLMVIFFLFSSVPTQTVFVGWIVSGFERIPVYDTLADLYDKPHSGWWDADIQEVQLLCGTENPVWVCAVPATTAAMSVVDASVIMIGVAVAITALINTIAKKNISKKKVAQRACGGTLVALALYYLTVGPYILFGQ